MEKQINRTEFVANLKLDDGIFVMSTRCLVNRTHIYGKVYFKSWYCRNESCFVSVGNIYGDIHCIDIKSIHVGFSNDPLLFR